MNIFEKCGFLPADIYLPNSSVDMSKWSVIACDQYTSDKSYWTDVENIVGESQSAYNLILPEMYLGGNDVSKRISDINTTMEKYDKDGTLECIGNCYVYVERTLADGTVRHGIVGMLDLELYDFSKGSESRVRATEGTIVERIPPRLEVRKNALFELPHIMLLIDDETKSIIETLYSLKENFEKLYDHDLMKNGGHIAGYKIPMKVSEEIAEKISMLGKAEAFEKKYNTNKSVLQYAVGDGNHSLATAKTHYINNKNSLTRYALCELVNLHDDSLVFEAIHRTVFDADVNKLLDEFVSEYSAYLSDKPSKQGHSILICANNFSKYICIEKPKYKLAVATLQNFLDKYLKENAGRIDYIHGEAEAKAFASKDNTVSFILPAMDKSELFSAVINDGALPRKTFSMGNADTKRFYTEARKIKE